MLGERIFDRRDLVPGSAGILLHELRSDFVLPRLLLPRRVAPALRDRLDDDEPAARFEGAPDVLEHRLVLGHLVIGVDDQRRVERSFG
jgi:hypothetical protein